MKKVLDKSETTRCFGIPVKAHDNSKATYEFDAPQFEREISPLDTSSDFRFGTGGKHWPISLATNKSKETVGPTLIHLSLCGVETEVTNI